jgi:hypothetical protein
MAFDLMFLLQEVVEPDPTPTPTPETPEEIEERLLQKEKVVDFRLNSNHDIYLINSDLAITSGIDELKQRILIRLKFFFKEWFLDTTVGIKYYESILIKSPDVNLINNIYKAAIIEEPEIIDFEEFSVDFSVKDRKLDINFVANTTYGTLTFTEEITI